MDTTRTQKVAGARSHRSVRSLILVAAIALAIVLSMAVVNASTNHGSTGGQALTTTIAPISAPKTDPAAQIHLKIARGLEKLSNDRG